MKTTTTAALRTLRTLHYAALTLVLAVAGPARAETTNCTPITSVPYVITVQGVYCFTGNIATSITSGAAIEIQTNNVTLDMNGFKLGGLAAGLGTGANGIHALQRQNITIRNGIVRGFFTGIWFEDSSPYTASQGHLVEDVLADQNTYTGIDARGRGCVLRRNQVIATGGSTILPDAYGITVVGPGNDVLNNRIAGTAHTATTYGIYLQSAAGSVVEGNRVSGDTGGALAYGVMVTFSDEVLVIASRITTADFGIVFSSSTGKYMDNVTAGLTGAAFTGGTAVGTNN